MKKSYITPEIRILDCETTAILYGSTLGADGNIPGVDGTDWEYGGDGEDGDVSDGAWNDGGWDIWAEQ